MMRHSTCFTFLLPFVLLLCLSPQAALGDAPSLLEQRFTVGESCPPVNHYFEDMHEMLVNTKKRYKALLNGKTSVASAKLMKHAHFAAGLHPFDYYVTVK